MKLQASWITEPNACQVMSLLINSGHQAYFVGGCVRNALMDVSDTDIDIATDARPDKVIQLAKNAGLKALPTGIDHGTITIIAGDVGYEITTFRKDVVTDGRRAVVAYADSIEEDALRRDFTINALYADADGLVHDPLNGLQDIKSKTVRFIENPTTRIKEDYLRILRFFRFHSWYGDAKNGLDADGLAACSELSEGLQNISKERIGSEFLKLLSAPDPAMSISAMSHAGILSAILPGSTHENLAPLIHLEGLNNLKPDPIRRLAILFAHESAENLRLSKKQEIRLTQLQKAARDDIAAHELGYRFGSEEGLNICLLRAAAIGQPMPDVKSALNEGAKAQFPITAQDLMPGFQGKALGDKLTALEKEWIASKFKKTKADLL